MLTGAACVIRLPRNVLWTAGECRWLLLPLCSRGEL